MKAREVLKLLNITRPTLCKYVKTNKIQAIKMSNGLYDYDEDSIMRLMGKAPRKVVTYIRAIVDDISLMEDACQQYAQDNGLCISQAYKDKECGFIQSGTQYEQMLFDIITFKIKCVIIPYNEVLGFFGNSLFYKICDHFACKVITINKSTPSTQEIIYDKQQAINKIVKG